MNTHGIFEFKVRGYECGPDGKATFATLCNYMQEAAGLQASIAHMAKQDFNAEGEDISWILTRMRVKIDRYPKWWEVVKVLTFPRGGRKIIAYRDFLLSVGDEVIGCATSEWMLLNLQTRKLVAVPQRVYDIANDEMAPVMGLDALSKLRWTGTPGAADGCQPGGGGSVCHFRARRGDIDINGHVNNVKYIEWAIEALPSNAGEIADFEIAYKSETMAGEELISDAVLVEDGAWMVHVAANGGADHVVAKAKCRT